MLSKIFKYHLQIHVFERGSLSSFTNCDLGFPILFSNFFENFTFAALCLGVCTAIVISRSLFDIHLDLSITVKSLICVVHGRKKKHRRGTDFGAIYTTPRDTDVGVITGMRDDKLLVSH